MRPITPKRQKRMINNEQRIVVSAGCWRLKKEVLIIPKEYNNLNEIEWQEI